MNGSSGGAKGDTMVVWTSDGKSHTVVQQQARAPPSHAGVGGEGSGGMVGTGLQYAMPVSRYSTLAHLVHKSAAATSGDR